MQLLLESYNYFSIQSLEEVFLNKLEPVTVLL